MNTTERHTCLTRTLRETALAEREQQKAATPIRPIHLVQSTRAILPIRMQMAALEADLISSIIVAVYRIIRSCLCHHHHDVCRQTTQLCAHARNAMTTTTTNGTHAVAMSKWDLDMYGVAGHGAKVAVATGPLMENLCVVCTTQTDPESVLDIVIRVGPLIHMTCIETRAAHKGEENQSTRGGTKVRSGIRG